ncbi:hypothetical protein CDAR_307751 [Caerostris darwini]|uniref:Uncharacterized protein n=1 Tax=Caerostris darwini TaxID=1538125 RepID=A0AAV4WJU3_9ARAC|nr:hypothetical protein CDAR_307751 [Caerostris darwini]
MRLLCVFGEGENLKLQYDCRSIEKNRPPREHNETLFLRHTTTPGNLVFIRYQIPQLAALDVATSLPNIPTPPASYLGCQMTSDMKDDFSRRVLAALRTTAPPGLLPRNTIIPA